MNKTVLFYWGKDNPGKDPLDFGIKRKTYLDLMGGIESRGFSVYLCSGRNNYLGDNRYSTNFIYKNGEILPQKEIVSPNSVYDRSAGLAFPESHSRNVLNNLEFKSLVNNKWLSYLSFPKFFSKTLLIDKNSKVSDLLGQFRSEDLLVIKPIDGLKGKLVEFIKAGEHEELEKLLRVNSDKSFIAQEFIDTSKGFPGVEGVHDLRVVIVNNKIVWSHVRSPAKGILKANVAEGGSILEMNIAQLPKSVLEIVDEVKEKFYKDYDNPVYSIDFGISNDRAFIFEFNDTIGFPLPDMKNKDNFIRELSNRLCTLS